MLVVRRVPLSLGAFSTCLAAAVCGEYPKLVAFAVHLSSVAYLLRIWRQLYAVKMQKWNV